MYNISYIIATFRNSKIHINNYLFVINKNFSFDVEVIVINDNPNTKLSTSDFQIPSEKI